MVFGGASSYEVPASESIAVLDPDQESGPQFVVVVLRHLCGISGQKNPECPIDFSDRHYAGWIPRPNLGAVPIEGVYVRMRSRLEPICCGSESHARRVRGTCDGHGPTQYQSRLLGRWFLFNSSSQCKLSSLCLHRGEAIVARIALSESIHRKAGSGLGFRGSSVVLSGLRPEIASLGLFLDQPQRLLEIRPGLIQRVARELHRIFGSLGCLNRSIRILLGDRGLPYGNTTSYQPDKHEAGSQPNEIRIKPNLPLFVRNVFLFVSFVSYLLLGLFAFYVVHPRLEEDGFSLTFQVIVPALIVMVGQVLLYLAICILTAYVAFLLWLFGNYPTLI